MSQQTGNSQIDALLAKFAKARIKVRMDRSRPEASVSVAEVAQAAGMCQVLAARFEDWACRKLPDGWQVYGSRAHTPDEHGYTDRTIEGFPTHSSSTIEGPGGELYRVDWSAGQYGYQELPMVMRAGSDGTWQREW